MTSETSTLDACSCCEGITQLTPQDLNNLPGLSAVAYRVGTHGSFKSSMLVDLSGPGGAGKLTTRSDDDPSIALLDACATMLDVLTFYQERIANEGYLRTATERLSVLELARAIGYELNPGVAASTFLAFEMETAPTAPTEATIAIGTKVQSLPGQDEKPQTFETIEAIEARTVWNRLKPQTFKRLLPKFGDTELYLQGTATNLKQGDALLLIGDERKNDPGNENWDFRRVQSVKPVTPTTGPGYTVVTLERGLGSSTPHVEPAKKNLKVYALRQRANLFGYNAPDWNTLPVSLRVGEISPQKDAQGNPIFIPGIYANRQNSWADAKFAATTNVINLDAIYSSITQASWTVLNASDWSEVFQVQRIEETTKSDYNLNVKTTQLTITGEQIEKFSPRTASVFAQSEEILLAAQPITTPLQGDTIVLDQLLLGLTEQRTLIVTGKPLRASVLQRFTISSADGAQSVTPNINDSLILAQAPVTLPTGQVQWRFTDKNKFTGALTLNSSAASATLFVLTPALSDDSMVSEVVTIKQITPNVDPTEIVLTAALANLYDRTTVFLYANVARATHGETRQEVLGSGNAAQAFQNFTLKQAPLTYVSAATASGAQTTLQVRINDVLWREVPSLYNLTPRDHAYITRRDDDGKTTLQFGDGVNGARVPTGDENVSSTYRTGIGATGMVKAGQLSLLMTRPLGVQKVTNPLAPSGAADPEDAANARQNAPFTVLTLDRVVSLKDFEDFARAFAGIGKAQAVTLWDGEKQLVYLTIAASSSNGVDFTIDPTAALFQNLRQAIDAARDTVQPLEIAAYEPLFFKVEARLLIDPAYIAEKVLADATSALTQAYAFAQRAFGQPVQEGEVLATIQKVPGVQAVFLDALYFKGDTRKLQTPLPARGAIRDLDGKRKPAQLLLLAANGVSLTALLG